MGIAFIAHAKWGLRYTCTLNRRLQFLTLWHWAEIHSSICSWACHASMDYELNRNGPENIWIEQWNHKKKPCFYLRVLYITISRLQIMLQFSKAKEAILADYKKEENKSITIRVCTNVKRAGMEGIVLRCTEIGLIIIRFFSTSNFKTSKYCCKSLIALQVIYS